MNFFMTNSYLGENNFTFWEFKSYGVLKRNIFEWLKCSALYLFTWGFAMVDQFLIIDITTVIANIYD